MVRRRGGTFWSTRPLAYVRRYGRVVAVSIDANMGCRGLESLPVHSLWKSQRFPGQGPFWPVSAGRPGRALSNPCAAGSGLRHCQSSRFTASLDDKIEPAHESLQQPAEHTAVRAEPLLPFPTYRRPDAIGQRRDLPRSGSASSVLGENWRSVRVVTPNGVLMRIQ